MEIPHRFSLPQRLTRETGNRTSSKIEVIRFTRIQGVLYLLSRKSAFAKVTSRFFKTTPCFPLKPDSFGFLPQRIVLHPSEAPEKRTLLSDWRYWRLQWTGERYEQNKNETSYGISSRAIQKPTSGSSTSRYRPIECRVFSNRSL